MSNCTTPSLRIILLVTILAAVSSGQGSVRLFAPNPVDISTDYHGKKIAIWGENLNRPGLQVEWNSKLHAGSAFTLTFHLQNEVTLKIPATLDLPLGIQTLRLYDPAARAYSNPIRLIVNRATQAPNIPLEGASRTVLDHFWGLWGGEGAVLQQNNIYAFVDLFDCKISKYKSMRAARHGLPLMGFEVCADLVITDPASVDTVVPGDGKEAASGWVWEGCPNWPNFTHNWWAELYPPETLASGAYTVKLKAISDGKYSNSRSLIVLPQDTPPFLLSLDRGAAVEGYSSALPEIQVRGYNLNKATRVIFSGASPAIATLRTVSAEEGSFTLPPALPPGDYLVHLGDATGAISNRRPFKVMMNRPVLSGPNVTTFVQMDFREKMYVRHGSADRWEVSGPLRFVENTPGKSVPFFWKENVDNIFYNGRRTDGHTLLHPDRGTIEIRGYRPKDWPLGRSRTGTTFNHGYHHILNIFPQDGDWHSKQRILVRALYYIPHTTNPASWGYWHVWSHWNGLNLNPEGSWTHFEVVVRDDYEQTDTAVIVTDPSFAAELADPMGSKAFDIKFVYDFADKKEGAIYVKIHGQDKDWVDRTYRWSRKIARTGDRLDLSPLIPGAFDLGTEKRHPHRILEASQTAKSNAGGTIDEVVITDQGFAEVPRPEITFTPFTGSFKNLQQFSFKVLVKGSRWNIDYENFDLGFLYIQGGRQTYHSLLYPGFWNYRVISEEGKEGFEFTLKTDDPFPGARYVVSATGLRYDGAWSNRALADFTVLAP